MQRGGKRTRKNSGLLLFSSRRRILKKGLKKMNEYTKYIKLGVLNILIALLFVILYSPGLIGLRPSDASILRAGLSIIFFLLLLGAFIIGNYCLIRTRVHKKIISENVNNTEQAISILKTYKDGRYFGSIASTEIEQLRRLEKSIERAKDTINSKFTPSSMSWEKYFEVVDACGCSAIRNVISMANRMQLFDEKEYERLQYYKEDDIPDDIQEKQIELYSKNLELIKSAIQLNEQIILKLDTLSMEMGLTPEDSSDQILDEITELTEELKYYNNLSES